jgi:Na+/proline symporter/signal transduction histidine kinase
MLQGWVILAVSAAYLGGLFAIAYWGDQRAKAGRSLIANPLVYALSGAVYCTAWTFYGSVGRATTSGIGFLPIYLGPTLAAVLWWVLLRKIVRISKKERITSIADFIAARYGKSTALGVLVTVGAIVGVVPYLALQLKAVASSFLVLWQAASQSSYPFEQTSLSVAAVLALFAILFGTRSLDLTEQHEGLVLAIAFESVIKLVAFLAVGAWITFGVYEGFGDLFARAAAVPELRELMTYSGSWGEWLWLNFIAMMAILFLPRQFQVSVVENVDEGHLRTSAWLFPLYLLVINVFVLPIAFAGLLQFGQGNVDPDTFVLALPLALGHQGLALFVFLGGLSAATGMVIVETVALSTLVSNDLVLPILLRRGERREYPRVLLFTRRIAICALLALAHAYVLFTGTRSLVSIGLISFAAVSQFAPAMLGGIFWKGGTRQGAMVGLIGGLVVWAYTLPLPTLVSSGWLPPGYLESGPFGLGFLRPYALFGLEGLDPISHSMFWSLLANLGGYVAVSSATKPSDLERRQARRFVDVFELDPRPGAEPSLWRGDTPLDEVRDLLERFLGPERTEKAFDAWAESRGIDLRGRVTADAELVEYAEKLLAGTTGAASARVALASVAREQKLGVGEVLYLLDETSKVIATSRQLEEKSQQLEAATRELQGVNERLRELDRLKDDFLSTMAHELRTPLTSIRAFAEILHDHPQLEESQRTEFLRIIAKENERLSRLINQLLDLAKVEAGGGDWHFAPCDLGEIALEALAATSQLMAERGIACERAIEKAPRLPLDRDRMMQVLLNLLSNAIKFCPPEGGRLRVGLAPRGEGLRLVVEDNGPGVAPEEREAIFEKFHQVALPVAGRTHGTGLGLPICRRIVERHGGTIHVEESPLGGARFVVDLEPANG